MRAAVAGAIRGIRLVGAATALVLALATLAHAADGPARHGLSPFGDLKYAPTFAHFDYVNPDAPKGGTLSMVGVDAKISFDSLNPFILKGDFPEGLALNNSDTGGSLVFDSLMTPAGDEADALYGLLAESVELSADRGEAVFHLRPEARWHDGTPVTANDVAFTVNALKKDGHPNYRFPLREVTVKVRDARTVAFTFAGDAKRDLVLFVASLPIASAAYYAKHSFKETTLEPPLGSGPYRVGDFKPGRFIAYTRVPDYWGRDLPVNRGRWNFDVIRYEFYRDRGVAFEAFKAGTYDLREEFTSKTWATEYNFPALAQGRVKKLTLPDENPSGVQGIFLNTRRPALADPRVREALNDAFDFEWLNKTVFYGLYQRTYSYFQNSTLEARGAPTADELKLLAPYRDRLPAGVFGPALRPPATDGSGNNRANLRKARALLEAVGWRVVNGKLVDAKGEPMVLEFLTFEPRMSEITNIYVQTLNRLGIEASVRQVDPAQYERRTKAYDFDATTRRYSMRLTPGVELREYFSSSRAAVEGTPNISGIADPVVDALIEKVIAAPSREELTTAAHALDRVLLAGYYWIPNWYKASHHLAYWDKFGQPAVKPRYQRGIVDTWWLDPKREAALKR